jgi:hypothetical protein
MRKTWEKPELRELTVNGECTAYSGAHGSDEQPLHVDEWSRAGTGASVVEIGGVYAGPGNRLDPRLERFSG